LVGRLPGQFAAGPPPLSGIDTSSVSALSGRHPGHGSSGTDDQAWEIGDGDEVRLHGQDFSVRTA
jgi:hypothetical protein